MKSLLVSGTTHDLIDWDVQSVITELDPKERILQYNTDNNVGPYCDGLTYLELEVLNNIK